MNKHIKFQGHQPFGSREEDLNVFTIYGHGGYLHNNVIYTNCTHFHSPIPWKRHMNLASISQGIYKEKKLENVESE